MKEKFQSAGGKSLKRIASPAGQFIDGFLYWFRGFGFLAKHAKLWPFAVVPFMINMVIVLAAGAVLAWFLPDIGRWIMKAPDEWYMWFVYVPIVALLILIVPVMMYILFFVILPGIVTPPFKSKLTKHVRQILKNTTVTPVSGLYVDVIEPTLIEIRKAVRLLAISLMLLPLNLIPVAGSVAYLVLMSYITWMYFALNYLEYPIDSESSHTPLDRKRAYVRSRRWPALGFGCAISLLYMVPFLGFFCIPVGVVGATLLYQAYGEMEGV